MNKRINIIISTVLASSLLASCAQKQRTEVETKPKVTIKAVTNTANTQATNSSVANQNVSNAAKITVAKKTFTANNNNNNGYVPPVQVEQPTNEPITVPEVDTYTEPQPESTTPETTPVTNPPTNPTTNSGNTNNNNTSGDTSSDTTGDTTPNNGEVDNTEGTTTTTNTNAPDPNNPAEMTIPLNFKEKEKVTLRADMYAYGTAEEAINGYGDSKDYLAGEYYVYKINPDGAINISKDPNVPGAWIRSGEYLMEPRGESSTVPDDTESTTTTTNTTTTTDRIPLGTKVTVDYEFRVYGTAQDAINKENSTGTYKAGTYYVVKYSNGAVNLSSTNDKPGAWVSPEVDIKKAEPTTPANGTIVENGDGTVTVKGKVNVYGTADDAKKRTNAKYTYDEGTYYIYKSVDGMLNISKTEGSPGAWVNPDPGSVDAGETVDDGEDATGNDGDESTTVEANENTGSGGDTTPSESNGVAIIDGQKVTLNGTMEIYGTAYDAVHKQNPIGTYDAGNYNIFKESDGMYNISPYEGAPGGWINPGGTVSNNDTSTTTNTQTTPEGGQVVDGGDGYDTVEGSNNQLPQEVAAYFTNDPYEISLNYHGVSSVRSATIDKEYTREDISEINSDELATRVAELLNTGMGWTDEEYDIYMEKSGSSVGALNIITSPNGGSLDNVTTAIINKAFANMSYPAGSGNGYGSVSSEIAGLLSKAASNPGTMYASVNGNVVMKVIVSNGLATIKIADYNVD